MANGSDTNEEWSDDWPSGFPLVCTLLEMIYFKIYGTDIKKWDDLHPIFILLGQWDT